MSEQESSGLRGGSYHPSSLGSPQPEEGVITLKYAQDFIEWRKRIRAIYPEKFVWIKGGEKVRWGERYDRVGQVVSIDYFPKPDTYLIEVQAGSQIINFRNPQDLEVIDV